MHICSNLQYLAVSGAHPFTLDRLPLLLPLVALFPDLGGWLEVALRPRCADETREHLRVNEHDARRIKHRMQLRVHHFLIRYLPGGKHLAGELEAVSASLYLFSLPMVKFSLNVLFELVMRPRGAPPTPSRLYSEYRVASSLPVAHHRVFEPPSCVGRPSRSY